MQHRKITLGLRETGDTCGRHRVRRRVKLERLRAQVAYDYKPRFRSCPTGVIENLLDRAFTPTASNKVRSGIH